MRKARAFKLLSALCAVAALGCDDVRPAEALTAAQTVAPGRTRMEPKERVPPMEAQESLPRLLPPVRGGQIVQASVAPENNGSIGGQCREIRTINGVQYRCHVVSGPFDNVFLTGAACAPRSTTCTGGELGGDFPATYDFFFRSQVPANDPENPTRQLFVGTSIIDPVSGGQLFGDDFGTIDFLPTGTAPFRTLIDIQGGVGAFEGAQGQLLARGEVDLVTGTGGGTYSGEVCVPVSPTSASRP